MQVMIKFIHTKYLNKLIKHRSHPINKNINYSYSIKTDGHPILIP